MKDSKSLAAVPPRSGVQGDGLARRGRELARRPGRAGAVYLVVDSSSSMASDEKLPQALRGAVRFYLEAARRDYAVGVIAFGDGARCLVGAGAGYDRLLRRLAELRPTGRTAMARALRLATRRLHRRSGHRAIFLITDGVPNSREATLDAARVARARGIEIIAVGTDHADWSFLAALTPRPELATMVERSQLEATVGGAAFNLPRSEPDTS